MRFRRWPTTRPPVSIPFDATIMYGRGRRRDLLRLLDAPGLDLVRIVERRVAVAEELRGLLVVGVGVATVDVGRLRGHRRVEVERQQRDLAALDHPVELPDDLLGAADRERRDEEHPVRVGDEPHGLGEDPDGLVLGLVLAAAVGRFDEDVVGVGLDRRVADDRRAGPAEVAARRRSSAPRRRAPRRGRG